MQRTRKSAVVEITAQYDTSRIFAFEWGPLFNAHFVTYTYKTDVYIIIFIICLT